MKLITIPFFLLTLLFIVETQAATPAQLEWQADYQLAVSFDCERGLLTGTSRIEVKAGETLALDSSGLTITGILLKRQDTTAMEGTFTSGTTIIVDANPKPQELFVSYTYQAGANDQNLITSDAITLLSGWYPKPKRKMHYQLSASLPEGFTAISESETFPLARKGNIVTAALHQPLSSIHFAAARYDTAQITVRNNLRVHTLFFPEDRALANDYLKKARGYIIRYEKEIGPYPYGYYAVVANRNPTGLGMPTFTLLGQAVLRLPFIKDTSLGHEIIHSWFGNSVDVDPSQGNWCEGLTSYLADHAFRTDEGEGAAYRKEAILNYLSYVHETNVIPLSDFIDAGHSQPEALARRAVGYSRGMMLFHELHERLGHAHFMNGLRAFYAQHQHGSATWNDLRLAFAERSHGVDLSQFFTERLQRTDIPAFHAEQIEVLTRPTGNLLTFTLVQETEKPYSLSIPVVVSTPNSTYPFTVTSDKERTEVELQLPERPLAFTLDPDSALLRRLDPPERPAIWSDFLGSERRLAILASRQDEPIFHPLLEILRNNNLQVKYDDEVKNSDLRDADLLLLGLNQQSVRTLFASPSHPKKGFTLDVRRNPLTSQHVAILVSSSSTAETAAVANRLSHYGKYGFLHFSQGRLTEKRIPESKNGVHIVLEEPIFGGATSQLGSFEKIVRELAEKDVIYIGENHTSVSDHLLQLRLIEVLSARIPSLAIGMEMFPATSQQALDEYVLGKGFMTEKDFLKASRYFEVWQYDYRYFREIFSLAKTKKIPVIGLNLERDIVSTVYRTGGTDELSAADRKSLPPERDLDLPGYSDRLLAVHSMHEQGGHGSGIVSGFIQAQAIWDETMAENIVKYLRQHSDRKMVVLAGNGHTRKDSGIPPRVARRMKIDQGVVLNVAADQPTTDIADIADYFFFSSSIKLEELPKMGVMLEEHVKNDQPYVEITDFSPTSKAPEAGLKKGDVLRNIAGFPVSDMVDVRIAMLDMAGAKTVNIQVERKQASSTHHLDFTIDLTPSQPPGQHP
ncbi:ChaN family lipoprotein [Desulfopila aestuarii]|uniref:Uncharacterized iron-regulated protein n=1 Tax=Desulfopila aestuarii DSM 18488 TaxID=1121416 RepID=A0A1M7Y879_9BACT|nr:ChaN family lipoprotein [Desulfopila aestuarii]SHO48827.1 Uncharacterized iron-regulated protein [Desulfopila aestuarii DSM 18488]